MAGDGGGAGHGLLIFISGAVAAGPMAEDAKQRALLPAAVTSSWRVTMSAGTGEVPDGGGSDPPAVVPSRIPAPVVSKLSLILDRLAANGREKEGRR